MSRLRGGIPDSFLPATWRGTTCVDRFGNQKIGVSFDPEQGGTTRLLLALDQARHLAESIQDSLDEYARRTTA